MEAKDIYIRGKVQGVGFRPFVYRIARRYGLKGFVRNETTGVYIHIEGENGKINNFIESIEGEKPTPSNIVDIEIKKTEFKNFIDFFIDFSQGKHEKFTFVSPDIATCDRCLEELFNPDDRRYKFPFINCTNCGPRFTITFDVPYDRRNTTMNEFEMCDICKAEYSNPESRRFHAQPNCCFDCGPTLILLNNKMENIEGEPIRMAAKFIREGYIVGIKGLGGYHLACNAKNNEAVKRLRSTKKRGNKPFGMMASIEMIKKECEVLADEERVLRLPAAPIVLMKKREDSTISDFVAPGQSRLGFMLPYTPIHHLLIKEVDLPLVMTSFNIADEPIEYNDENVGQHSDLYDYLLTHNRKIYIRADDSVISTLNGEVYPIRRSRGFVPDPIELPFKSDIDILGIGGDLKNTFCLIKRNYAFLSQYIGDMGLLKTEEAYKENLEHFKHIFDIRPEIIVSDLHPGYHSVSMAEKMQGVKLIKVQHHKAHFASTLADNFYGGDAIGVIFDGTGYGEDGNIWGGEFFVGSLENIERVAHLPYIPLPGGDMAVIEPWRYAISLLYYAFGDNFSLPIHLEKRNNQFILQMIKNSINSPLTSSMGRLFEGISALVGVCSDNTFEGEAAMKLESIAHETDGMYNFYYDGNNLDIKDLIIGISNDIKKKEQASVISYRFHRSISEIVYRIVSSISKKTGIKTVALGGGVFQNLLLMKLTLERLENKGYNVLIHRNIPTNDGGLSLGQAVMGYFINKGGK